VVSNWLDLDPVLKPIILREAVRKLATRRSVEVDIHAI